MKNIITASLLLLAFILSSFALSTESQSTKEYHVNTAESKIKWIGRKVMGSHDGHILIKEGKLQVENDQLIGGTFIIDMHSIKVTDMDEDSNKKLEGHLKHEDFFETNNFPSSTFTITKVETVSGVENANHMITGNLKMRGISKEVSFPANIQITDNGVKASTPAFSINRMLWGVAYSGMKDNLIKNDIELQIELSTK